MSAFMKDRAFSAGLTPQLASVLLYSLSPFNPNPDILENKDLLTELTKQYKVSRDLNCQISKEGRAQTESCSQGFRVSARIWDQEGSEVGGPDLPRGDPRMPAGQQTDPPGRGLLQTVLQAVPLPARGILHRGQDSGQRRGVSLPTWA